MEEIAGNSVNNATATPEEEPTASSDEIEDFTIPVEAIDNLSKGLLSLFMTDLEQVSHSLDELKQNHNILIETVQQENEKYELTYNTLGLAEMFNRMKTYHSKMQNIKKDLKIIQDKSQKIKQKALRLQLQREMENKQKETQRQEEMAKELKLLARPISSPASPLAPPDL